MKDRRGLLIVYTGNGKGKTTAALGTALRAVGQGFKVLMIQFIKGSWPSGELASTRLLGESFVIRPMGRGFVNPRQPRSDDVRAVEQAWEAAREAMASDLYDLLVLDEINCAVDFGMIPIERILEDLARRPPRLHVICTGRSAHAKLLEAADLASEMVEVKHPFQKGLRAARGIDY
jgi:cob(I)alamin adenosyltransferase